MLASFSGVYYSTPDEGRSIFLCSEAVAAYSLWMAEEEEVVTSGSSLNLRW